MISLTPQDLNHLLLAMDHFKSLAELLILKLINETNQPESTSIANGEYFLIECADSTTGESLLSGGWSYFIHGEHCLFVNQITDQELEVFLGFREFVGKLDPYFFYQFLVTTPQYQHLTKYFQQPFQDMCEIFDNLIELNILDKYFRKII